MFSTVAPLQDVTIDVGLSSLAVPVAAFLTTQIGPSTVVDHQIAAATYVGGPGPHAPLFHHLNLAPGTYYLVLDATGAMDSWSRLLPFTVNASPGMTRGQDYYSHAFASYAPAAGFSVNPHTADEGALQYRVRPTSDFIVDLVSDLITDVVALNLQAGITNAFDAKLNAVVAALDDTRARREGSALSLMREFVSAVEAQRGKKLADPQADTLVGSANEVIAILGR